MVNVNAQFPFRLHDRSAASSRNVSGGTLPSSRAPSPSPPRLLQKSPSTTSLHPDSEDAPHYLPLALNPSTVRSVRLVKSVHPTLSTRGRSPPSPDPQDQEPHLAAETHTDDFSIHDAGAVARSWGD